MDALVVNRYSYLWHGEGLVQTNLQMTRHSDGCQEIANKYHNLGKNK